MNNLSYTHNSIHNPFHFYILTRFQVEYSIQGEKKTFRMEPNFYPFEIDYIVKGNHFFFCFLTDLYIFWICYMHSFW